MNPDTLPAFFSELVAASWRAGWLILLVVALRRMVRGRIAAQVWFAAWIVVALRLLLPFSVPAAWSPYNLARPAVPHPATLPPESAAVVDAAITALPLPPPVAVAESVVATRAWTTREILSATWLAGVAAMIAVRLAAWMGFRRRLRMARPLGNVRVQALLVQEGGAAARLDVLETDAVDAPALYGLVRPRLLFPRGLVERLSEMELRHVVRHELGHWRRRDLLAQGLMQVAVALHWFNPLAWLAARLARADCELACDEFVLRREAANDGAGAYGATLLKVLGMVGRGRRPSPVVAMLEGREQLAHRIRMIAGYRAAGAGRAFAGVVLIAGIAIASITRESRADDATTAALSAAESKASRSEAAPRDLQAVVSEQQKRIDALAAELQTYKEKNGLASLDQRRDVVNDSLKAAHQEVRRVDQALASSEIRISQIAEYRQRGASLLALPFIASQPVVAQLSQQLATRKIDLAALLERYREAHPSVVAAQHGIAAIEKQLAEAVDTTCALIEADHDAARRNYQRVKDELARRTQESLELDQLALGYHDKERQLRNQENILQSAVQRQAELAAAAARPAAEFFISVMGAVQRQGAVRFSPDESPNVRDVIERAGGFAERADRNGVRVIRSDADGRRTTLVLTEAALVSAGALPRGVVVVVPELPESPAIANPLSGPTSLSYKLIALDSVQVRVATRADRKPGSADLEEIFNGPLAKGETRVIPLNGPQTLYVSAGQNVQMEFRGKAYPLTITGAGSVPIDIPPAAR